MDLEAFSSTLSLLRARIEAGMERPTVLGVTSARRGDGKSLVSYGLASNLAETSYKALFVDADGGVGHDVVAAVPKLAANPEFDIYSYVRSGGRRAPDMLDLSGPGVAETGSIDVIRAVFDRLRGIYDYTIIDMSMLNSSSLALLSTLR